MAVKQMWRSCKILMSWISSRKKIFYNFNLAVGIFLI